MNRREKVERKLDLLWAKLWYIRAWDEVVLNGRHTTYKPPHHSLYTRIKLITQFGVLKVALFILEKIEKQERK